MKKVFNPNKNYLIRGLQYSVVIFVGMFLFNISTQQQLSVDVLMQTLNDTVIAWAGIVATKYFTDYTK